MKPEAAYLVVGLIAAGVSLWFQRTGAMRRAVVALTIAVLCLLLGRCGDVATVHASGKSAQAGEIPPGQVGAMDCWAADAVILKQSKRAITFGCRGDGGPPSPSDTAAYKCKRGRIVLFAMPNGTPRTTIAAECQS